MFKRFVGLVMACLVVATALLGGTPAPAQAATLKERLKSAWVPSMCGHPAGRLVNGKLPNIEPNMGGVFLDSKLSKTGKLIKKKPAGAAAVFHCSQGGIGWPDHVVYYNSKLQVIGHLDTGSIGDRPGRQTVAGVSIKKRTVKVRVAAVPLPKDNELWGSSAATLTYRYSPSKKKVVKKKSVVFKEVATAKKVMSLVKKGKTKAARKYATKRVISELRWAYNASKNKKGKKSIKLNGCYGIYSDHFDSIESDTPYGLGYRSCVFEAPVYDEGYYAGETVVYAGFRMSHKYWGRWYADKSVLENYG